MQQTNRVRSEVDPLLIARQVYVFSTTERGATATGTTRCSSSRWSISWTHSRRCIPIGSCCSRSIGAQVTPRCGLHASCRNWHVALTSDICVASCSQHREGALNVNSMNVKYGGKQKTPRESKIPSDPSEAKAYLGTYPAMMKWQGENLDCLLKPGDTQHYYFKVQPPLKPRAAPARPLSIAN
jgi:hypothetical protein